jgi:hypothetical protein
MVELLTGKCPFDGDAHAMMGAALDETLRPTPAAFGLHLSAKVEAAFQQALAVDPTNRTTDMGRFWDVLEAEAGVATTRVLERPSALLSDAPPRLEAGEGQSSRTTVEEPARPMLVPDLDVAPGLPDTKKEAQKVGGARPPAPVAAEVPMRGGFRIDTQAGASFSGVGISTGAAPIRARSRLGEEHHERSVARARRSFLERLLGPARWVVVASAIMLADWLYTQALGESFQLGPVRAFWVAGPIAGYAILSLIGQLLSD